MEEAPREFSEEAIHKRYRNTLLKLDETIRNLRLANDSLNRQLYVLNNRTCNVSETVGFSTFDALESAVLASPDVWNVDAIQKINAEANRTEEESSQGQPKPSGNVKQGPSESPGIREELEQLKREVRSLQRRPEASPMHTRHMLLETNEEQRSPLIPLKSAGNASCSEDSILRARYHILSRKYDALLVAKKRAETKYKDDYKKWKAFKSWLFNKSKHAKALRAQPDDDSGAHNLITEDSFRAKQRHLLTFPDEGDVCSPSMRQELSSPLRRSNHAEKLKQNQLALDTRGLRVMKSYYSPTKISSAILASDKKEISDHSPTRSRRLTPPMHSPGFIAPEARPMKRSASWADSPSPTVEKRKEPLPELQNILKLEFVQGSSNRAHVSAALLESSRASTKRRSPYAGAASGGAINAAFEIDTSRNDGITFQFDEVVRGREHRRKLAGGDCDCCRDYYNYAGPLPSRLQPPVWKSPTANHIAEDTHCGDAEQHKKRISRHRHQWAPPTTPPDYWDIGFPTTQEAADINRRADDMHADKRRRVEYEANTGTGRYIRRNNIR